MSEAEYQIQKNLSRHLPYAGIIVDRPKYNPNQTYVWEIAVVRREGKTVRPPGQILELAVCPEDERFCIINNKQKSTIRTDAVEFLKDEF